VHKRRWIEGIKDRRFDVDEVSKGVALDSILEEVEAAYLKKALDCSRGNKNRAAELLGISFRSLRYRLEKLNLE
jgi:two-component system response regulator PilR (NtrC family)